MLGEGADESILKAVYYYTMNEVTLSHICNHPMSRSKTRNEVLSKSNLY